MLLVNGMNQFFFDGGGDEDDDEEDDDEDDDDDEEEVRPLSYPPFPIPTNSIRKIPSSLVSFELVRLIKWDLKDDAFIGLLLLRGGIAVSPLLVLLSSLSVLREICTSKYSNGFTGLIGEYMCGAREKERERERERDNYESKPLTPNLFPCYV